MFEGKLSMKAIKKKEYLDMVNLELISLRECASLLSLSYRQTIRINNRYKKFGVLELENKRSLRPPNLRYDDEIVKKVCELKINYYQDFNVEHFRDMLLTKHSLVISYESLRRILIKNNLHSYEAKKAKYRKRRRMPKTGMLIQMDTSEHRWFKSDPRNYYLILTIDDADSKIYDAKFFDSDNTFNNMNIIKKVVEKHGLFSALYVDRASHFETTRHSGVHYNIKQFEHKDTQIQRALSELGITLITAGSPQAKGRVERSFRTHQDRLINELALYGINNIKDANEYIMNIYIPEHNKKFALKNVESSFTKLSPKINLNNIFSIKHIRTVNKDNTVRFLGHILQLKPTKFKLNFAGSKVQVLQFEDDNVKIMYKDKIILCDKLDQNNKGYKEYQTTQNILEQKIYVKQPLKNTSRKKNNSGWKKSNYLFLKDYYNKIKYYKKNA